MFKYVQSCMYRIRMYSHLHSKPDHLLARLKTPLAGTLNFQTFLPVNIRFTTSSVMMARGNGQLINIYFAVSGAGNAHDQLLV